MIKDMTDGKPIRLMIHFSLPLLLSNSLQLLYTVADSAIVGRMLGVNAFASVGATASPHWLVLSAVIGMSYGFGTVFAQRFGSKDMDGVRRAFVTAACLAAALSAFIGALGALGCGAALRLLHTPPELMDGAVIYLSWLLGGMPIAFAYNLLSAMLYALGDSRTPLRAMAVSSVLNIVLDLVFIIPLGIAGVGLATLLAQAAASVYCFFALRKTGVLNGCGFRWDTASAAALLRLGLPLGFRNVVVEIGGLAVQRYVNGYGAEFVAGVAAAKRMYSLLMIAGGAFEATVAVFVAQNFGAGRYDRVKRGVSNGLWLMLASAAVIMAVVLPFGRFILGLLIEGEPTQVAAVLDVGTRQLNVLALGLPALYLLLLYRSALQGAGNTLIPMLSGFLELLLRVSSVLLLTPFLGKRGIFLSDPAAWAGACVLLFISYMIVYRKLDSQQT